MYDLRAAMTGQGGPQEPNPFEDPVAMALARRGSANWDLSRPQMPQVGAPPQDAGGGDLMGLLQMLMPMMSKSSGSAGIGMGGGSQAAAGFSVPSGLGGFGLG